MERLSWLREQFGSVGVGAITSFNSFQRNHGAVRSESFCATDPEYAFGPAYLSLKKQFQSHFLVVLDLLTNYLSRKKSILWPRCGLEKKPNRKNSDSL
jgi:hypothetical protein